MGNENTVVSRKGKALGSNLTASDIRPLIHDIRGVQVIMDRDLAAMYGVTTGALNQAVKRNGERFPTRFMFQLTDEEFENWKSQFVISNPSVTSVKMGMRKRPFAFTEHGVTMLASVLHSATAVRISIEIVDTFISMRKTLASMGTVVSRLETIERRQIVDQLHNDTRFDQIFSAMNSGDAPIGHVFYQGRFWDAKSQLVKFIRRAKHELVVIDPYIDVATLDMLAKRSRGVKIELITHSNGELAESDFEAFARQYGNFTKTLSGNCHDRLIIVDNKEAFVIGASLKDAGRLTFCATRLGPESIPGILSSLHDAAMSSQAYR